MSLIVYSWTVSLEPRPVYDPLRMLRSVTLHPPNMTYNNTQPDISSVNPWFAPASTGTYAEICNISKHCNVHLLITPPPTAHSPYVSVHKQRIGHAISQNHVDHSRFIKRNSFSYKTLFIASISPILTSSRSILRSTSITRSTMDHLGYEVTTWFYFGLYIVMMSSWGWVIILFRSHNNKIRSR